MQSDSSKDNNRVKMSAAPVYRSRAFWLTIALCAVLYLPSLFWALGLDQNIFAEIGSLLLSGHKPYVDAWDVKPPNIYYTYALFEWLFGQNDLAVRLADYLSALATCAVAYITVQRRLLSYSPLMLRWAPIVTALLLALTLLSLGLADTAQTESFAILFIFISLYLCTGEFRFADPPGGGRSGVRPYTGLIAAGAAIGIATFFKTTNAIFLLPLIVDIVFRYRAKAVRPIAFLIIGFAGWCALQIGVLAMEGSLSEYVRITQAVFLHHPQEVSSLTPLGLLRSLWTLADFWIVLVVTATVCTLLSRDRFFLRSIVTPLLFLLAGLAAVYLQNKGWGYHYVIVLPGLILLCALSGVYLFVQLSSWTKWTGWTAAAIIIGATFIFSPSAHRRIHYTKEALLSIRSHGTYLATLGAPHSLYYPLGTSQLASYLSDRTDPTDAIWIFGEEPGAYWKSRRTPATRFIYSLLFTSGVISQDELRAMNDSLIAKKPRIIVVERFDTLHFRGRPETSESLLESDSSFIPIREMLYQYYDSKDTVSENFIIYRRR